MSIASLQLARAVPGALALVTSSTTRVLDTVDGPVTVVVEDPAALARAAGEDLVTYTAGRLLASEGYGGDKQVGAAAAAVVQLQTALRAAGGRSGLVGKLLASKYDGARGRFGSQKGRYASTRQDPTRWHLQVAREVLSGRVRDISRGATNFMDPTAFGDLAEYEDVLNSWTRTLRWVGPIPTIAPAHFQAFVPSSDAGAREASRRAALAASRDRLPAPGFPDRGATGPRLLAASTGLVLGSGFLWWLFTKGPKRLRVRNLPPFPGFGMVDWMDYADPDHWRKVRGPVTVAVEHESFDLGTGELRLTARIRGKKVGELEAWTSADGAYVNVDNIAVGPRDRGIGTKLYGTAAHWACQTARRPLASDERRSVAAQGFWAKQVRKRRARCVWPLSAAERRAIKQELEFTPDEKPAWGRGGCARYALRCPAPRSLAGRAR